MVETICLCQNAFCIIGIDGDGVFTAGNRSAVILTHELGIGKGVPIHLRVGVVVQQLVEQSAAVFIFADTEEGAGHELFEIIRIVAL